MQKSLLLSLSLLIVIAPLLGSTALAQQLLGNQGFESGTLPPWSTDWTPYTAGALITTTATYSGTYGLWEYTDLSDVVSFSGTYQQVAALPSQSYLGSAWVRTTSSWVSGGEAFVRVQFMNSSGGVLVYYDSSHLTGGGSSWQNLSVQTPPAPSGTAYARLILRVQKAAGPNGQAVANFDDGSLTLAPPSPTLALSHRAVSFGETTTQVTVNVTNTGGGTLHWQVSTAIPWLTLSVTSGETATGPDPVFLTVSRTGLTLESYHTIVSFTSDGGNLDVDVYLDTPRPYTIPAQPSVVTTSGYQLMVQRRLPGGLLHAPQPYTILGVGWSPASVGTQSDRLARQAEFSKWADLDIAMLREMSVNTVYVFLDFGIGAQGEQLLDKLYKHHIMAIVTADWDGTNDTNRIAQVVSAYRNHPAVLMWAIGNEWNINLYQGSFPTLLAAANATQLAAQQIKALDSSHPVASIFGDINIVGANPSFNTIANSICTAVDVWGLNIYRGPTFGTLFNEWEAISAKPVFISEFGTDSYHTTTTNYPIQGYVDEAMQNVFVDSLLDELLNQLSSKDSSAVCLGGTVFEWVDEWWKVKPADGGSIYLQDNGGFYTTWNWDAHPDGCGNEEYFGIVRIDRSKKPLFATIQNAFAASQIATTPSDFDGDGKADILWQHSTTGQLFLWLMDGINIIGYQSPGTVSDLNWQIQFIGGFDGDGKADILWRHSVTGQLFLWLMDGINITGYQSPGTVGDLSWGIQGVGDFNGDGKADILWRHNATGQLFMWLMDGFNIIGYQPIGMVSDLGWQIQKVGDFNGDSKADILWRHSTTGQLFMWLMDGISIIGYQPIGTVSDLGWQIQQVGDFNGDGKADILWRHNTTGQLFVWLMDGVNISGSQSIGWVSDLGWQIQEVGDFNGDGKADILWRHDATGQLFMWLMDGFSTIGYQPIGTVSDLGWQIQK